MPLELPSNAVGICIRLPAFSRASCRASATRPLFVFVVGTLLSWRTFGMMQESLRPSALAAKGVAIVMIVVGTTALAAL